LTVNSKETQLVQELLKERAHVRDRLLSSNLKFDNDEGSFDSLLEVTVIIPAYNEEKNVGKVISETISVMDNLQLSYEIIVVDDGSTDKTGLVASSYGVNVVLNEKNRGKGYALRTALKRAKGEIIVTIDSDGEHKPREIPVLLAPLFNDTDIVAGSRFLDRDHLYVTTRLHQIGNSIFNSSIMALTGQRVTDSQTGFRAVKRDVFETLNLESDGYEIETEITVKSLKSGFVFEEKPISIKKRNHGTSKIKLLSDGTKILKTIIRANFAKTCANN
jgi:glycosyltransferase involved in cell wall biosynthesis